MKRQIKAIALSLALIATTACGANEAKQAEETQVAQVQAVETKEIKKANIEAPKANNVEVAKKDNRAYLIPQTVELKDEEVKEKASEEVVSQEVEEIKQDASQEVEESSEDEVIVAINTNPEVDSVSETAESTSLPKQVEETVSSNNPVEYLAEETKEVEEVAGGLTIASPSADEVRNYWRNYQSKAANTKDFYGINLIDQNSNEVFAIAPNADLNQFNLGEVSNAAEEDALHIANTARFASGITNELTLGADQRAFAQAATMVNRLNLQVSHNPAIPAGLDASTYNAGLYGAQNSNLASSFGILDSVVEYLKDDLGNENQLEVGHRRWILNPAASTVGFGQTEEFNAMFVNNNDYAGQNANTVYAYPGETAISEFHSAGSSLSIMFGENFDITNASVEVTDLATGEVNTSANIEQSFKGNSKAITFGYGMNYAEGTKLQVIVNGVTRNGEAYPVEYTINYVSIK